MQSLNVFPWQKKQLKVYCFDKYMVYLVNLDQRNFLKRKGISYIVKQHIHIMLCRDCKGSNPCNTNVAGGTRVMVAK